MRVTSIAASSSSSLVGEDPVSSSLVGEAPVFSTSLSTTTTRVACLRLTIIVPFSCFPVGIRFYLPYPLTPLFCNFYLLSVQVTSATSAPSKRSAGALCPATS